MEGTDDHKRKSGMSICGVQAANSRVESNLIIGLEKSEIPEHLSFEPGRIVLGLREIKRGQDIEESTQFVSRQLGTYKVDEVRDRLIRSDGIG